MGYGVNKYNCDVKPLGAKTPLSQIGYEYPKWREQQRET